MHKRPCDFLQDAHDYRRKSAGWPKQVQMMALKAVKDSYLSQKQMDERFKQMI